MASQNSTGAGDGSIICRLSQPAAHCFSQRSRRSRVSGAASGLSDFLRSSVVRSSSQAKRDAVSTGQMLRFADGHGLKHSERHRMKKEMLESRAFRQGHRALVQGAMEASSRQAAELCRML